MKLREDVIALGDTVAGGLLWRVGGRLNLTVIVKATFKLVADERMSSQRPQPIHRKDVLLASGRGVIAPSDLAPYLGKTDVIVCGGPRGSATPARVVLRGEADTLLDKAGPVAELGAIASTASVRRERLSAAVLRALEDDVPQLPVEMDWGYFQAAPADQQLPFLGGHEWLLLRELIPSGLVRSQLPGASAATWVWPRGGDFEQGYPVAMYADRMLVDADAEAITITWRGAAPLQSEEVSSALAVAAGVHLPDSPIDWSQASAPAPSDDVLPVSISGDGELSLLTPSLASTVYFVVPGEGVAADSSAAEPAQAEAAGEAPADASDEDALEGTIGIAQAIDPQAVTPFPLQRPASAGGKRSLPTPLPGAPWSDATSPPEIRAPLAGQAVGGTLSVPVIGDGQDDDALEGTIGIAQAIDPQAVTPFPLINPGKRPALSPVPLPGAPWSGIPSAPVVRVEMLDDPLEGTLGLQQSAAQPLSPWAGGAAVGASSGGAAAAPVLPFSQQPGKPAPIPMAAAAAAAVPAAEPPSQPPVPPAPVVAAAAAEAKPGETAAPKLKVPPASKAPEPAADASHGEAFLGALEWLEEHTKDG